MKKNHNKLLIIGIILILAIGIYYYSTSQTTIKETNVQDNQNSNTEKIVDNQAPTNPTDNIVSTPEVKEKPINITNSTPTVTVQEIKVFLGKTVTAKIKGWDQSITLFEITSPTTAGIKIEAVPRTVNEGSIYGISNINADIQIKDIYYDTDNKNNSYIIITVL